MIPMQDLGMGLFIIGHDQYDTILITNRRYSIYVSQYVSGTNSFEEWDSERLILRNSVFLVFDNYAKIIYSVSGEMSSEQSVPNTAEVGSSTGSSSSGGSTPGTPPAASCPAQQIVATPPQQSITPIAVQPQQVQLQHLQQLHHAGTPQLQSIPTANAVVRSSLPAQVQVIQPMGAGGGQFVSQSYMPQQLMLQNANIQCELPIN